MEIYLIIFSFIFSVVCLFFIKKFIFFEMTALLSMFLHGLYIFGNKIILVFIITYIVSTIFELLSLKTSFNIFGVRYKYNLNNKIFSSKINLMGVYPLEVTFAWVIFKYLSLFLAITIGDYLSLSKITEIILLSLIMVSIDLIIDPVSVKRKMWSWQTGSRYFGIPLKNFFGWFLVSIIVSFISIALLDLKILNNNLLVNTLPIFSCLLLFMNVKLMYSLNKHLALIGCVPFVLWIILSALAIYHN
ncbi:hypothetical protein COV53_06205 [Candidatus Gottesmanbacteria bacterium CG11_big_fil_rev_8_21_14_0_20_37_11]|uniref:Carotenoid biosynthesis protein n=3 Tax=Candidatus Gottesmaniibacteriota TaxID=1752720 RepID=A0A2M7RR85_9BACT|nr:MAG: hypothetical protein AUJ73_04780 [Candidatus Gottesmanbacteria bacterium CG1_02_37_22]PIP32369.1 MAG: hypothetical protein COX23_05100 [Candidatus Gottesmanbacteria bacterium CG23_combo_of_CG06-09_8_20_14_all_37_19]PIR07809.1 MAG: hypothetical protein COV53_06205 [Candidatus Gottesmanbacteria bacterium CG11_big_fil_rev_8_21_14_0_20_37_11]PIZ02827.1 MAG: hypothetical protein COY59_02595 [Candidatus Gottesmanbacteria bacterium CG_4_10_14_0_8_um_filter_37_24]